MVVTGVEMDAAIHCPPLPEISILNPAVSVDWTINNMPINSFPLHDHVNTNFNGIVGSLRFHEVPLEYNSTSIQCRINYTSGPIVQRNFVLHLQGKKQELRCCMDYTEMSF